MSLHVPTAIFDVQRTKVITQEAASSLGHSKQQIQVFQKLEATVLEKWDRKGKKPMTLLPEAEKAVASHGGMSRSLATPLLLVERTADFAEMFHVELIATNPLNCPLTLSAVTVTLDPPIPDAGIATTDDIFMEPYESRSILLPITLPPISQSSPSAAQASFTISTVEYRFNRFFPVSQPLVKKGKRLHTTKAHRLAPTYASDTSLRVEIVPPRPRVRAEWVDLTTGSYEGEVVNVGLQLELVGGAEAVQEIELVPSIPGMLRLASNPGE